MSHEFPFKNYATFCNNQEMSRGSQVLPSCNLSLPERLWRRFNRTRFGGFLQRRDSGAENHTFCLPYQHASHLKQGEIKMSFNFSIYRFRSVRTN